jgi:hypothetical protein
MDLQFSEFSYGYALIQEIQRLYVKPLKCAPIFPSLQDEGTKGYDVELRMRGLKPNSPGIPLFLQFKLSERIERRFKGRTDDLYYDPPFYRVKLRTRRPNQHELLVRLQRRGKEVYYAAPAFHKTTELNKNFSDDNVFGNSIFVKPSSLGKFPEGEPHHFSFASASDPIVRRFSERKPTEVKVIRGRTLVESHRKLLLSRESQAYLLSADTLGEMEHELLNTATPEDMVEGLPFPFGEFPKHWREMGVLNRIAYIARVAYESTLFLIGIAEESSA